MHIEIINSSPGRTAAALIVLAMTDAIYYVLYGSNVN